MVEDLEITKLEICLAGTILKSCPSITFLESREYSPSETNIVKTQARHL